MEYHCPNGPCAGERKKPYMIRIEEEALMDEKNVATMFCPYCNSKLERKSNSPWNKGKQKR